MLIWKDKNKPAAAREETPEAKPVKTRAKAAKAKAESADLPAPDAAAAVSRAEK